MENPYCTLHGLKSHGYRISDGQPVIDSNILLITDVTLVGQKLLITVLWPFLKNWNYVRLSQQTGYFS